MVKEPEIFPGSLDDVVDANELIIAEPVSILGLGLIVKAGFPGSGSKFGRRGGG